MILASTFRLINQFICQLIHRYIRKKKNNMYEYKHNAHIINIVILLLYYRYRRWRDLSVE